MALATQSLLLRPLPDRSALPVIRVRAVQQKRLSENAADPQYERFGYLSSAPVRRTDGYIKYVRKRSGLWN